MFFFDVLVERHPGDVLDDQAGERRAVVRVRRPASPAAAPAPGCGRRAPRASAAARSASFTIRKPSAPSSNPGVWVRRFFMVIGCGVGRRDLEVLQVGVDVGVEVELALLDELHDRRPGEQLGDRAGPEQRLVRHDRDPLLAVGEAVALGEEQLAVLDHRDRRGRDVPRRQVGGHHAVDERLELRRGRLDRRAGRRGGRAPARRHLAGRREQSGAAEKQDGSGDRECTRACGSNSWLPPWHRVDDHRALLN